jgi:hypothetical protein
VRVRARVLVGLACGLGLESTAVASNLCCAPCRLWPRVEAWLGVGVGVGLGLL